MEGYDKIIDSLKIQFTRVRNIHIVRTITVESNYEVENTLILLKNGQITFGKDKQVASSGDIIFIPSGQSGTLTYGSGKSTVLSKDEFLLNQDQYLKAIDKKSDLEIHYSYISFEARAFDLVSFFPSLNTLPFKINNNPQIKNLMMSIDKEHILHLPGKDRSIKLLTEFTCVELIRHIITNNLFTHQLNSKNSYFKDTRLIDIFTFVNENLNKDLSNKTISNVANVSEEYVGQYFKLVTGLNVQDFIEYQRMEEAVKLLRTSMASIKEIGKQVGYKDTPYFCRRFKMMFGISAGKMRKREDLVNN